jgi:hypothetical protein
VPVVEAPERDLAQSVNVLPLEADEPYPSVAAGTDQAAVSPDSVPLFLAYTPRWFSPLAERDVELVVDGDVVRPRIVSPTSPLEWQNSEPFTRVIRRLDRWHRLRRPLRLVVEPDSEGYIVHDDLTHRHAEGITLSEALSEYRGIVLAYWRTLKENRDRLTPRLKGHLRLLDELIEEA